MSNFYGNISNVSKTQMSFDIIYPSRTIMDENVASDSVAIGRYVLIQYGEKAYSTRFYLGNGGALYVTVPSEGIRAEVGKHIAANEIIHILPDYNVNGVTIKHNFSDSSPAGLYKCSNQSGAAIVEQVTGAEVDQFVDYYSNYIADKVKYGAEKGYDATVWVKTIKNGSLAYQYVADLNTVLPTFGVTINPPTERMSAPHFGANAEDTNVLYNLNVQPNWGFRVKEAVNADVSDSKTTHAIYNNGSWTTKNVNADIYFNRAGFKKERQATFAGDNKIEVTAAGKSGYVYSDKSTHVDTKELSIQLPGIGNAISDFWDIVYGVKADKTRDTSLSGISLFTEADVNTLVGAIKTMQRLLGNIVEVDNINSLTQENLKTGYENATLYKNKADNKYYIAIKHIAENPAGSNIWVDTGSYSVQQIDILDSMNSIYKMMAQLGQEVYTVDTKVAAYYNKLDEAVKNVKTFHTVSVTNSTGATGGQVEAAPLSDSLNIASLSEQLLLSASEPNDEDKISLSLRVATNFNNASEDNYLVTKGAVETTVLTYLGDVKSILHDINN